MVILPHALTGARLAQGRGPIGALVVGTASHYLLDQVPHRDYLLDGALGKAKAGAEFLSVFALLAATDKLDRSTLAGAFGGVLPDVVCVLAPRSLPTRVHHRLHTPLRPSRPLNLLLQGAVCYLSLRGLKKSTQG